MNEMIDERTSRPLNNVAPNSLFLLAFSTAMKMCPKLARPGIQRNLHGCRADAMARRLAPPALAQASASATASSTFTATSREQPGSCIVTPIRWSAISMAILLWVM